MNKKRTATKCKKKFTRKVSFETKDLDRDIENLPPFEKLNMSELQDLTSILTSVKIKGKKIKLR